MAAESTEGPVELGQIVNQYKQELQDYCGGYLNFLQEKSREFSQTVDAAGNLMKEAEKDKGKRLEFGVVRPLKNMAPVELSNMMLLQYFSWLAIMMSAYSFAFSILSTVLEPLIALTFTGIQSVFLIVLIPTIAYKKINPGMDVQSRYYLFIFALLEGIVVGHLFPDYHLALPPPFILPICVAISAQLFSKKPVASRIQFLGFSLALHLALNFALGLTVTNGMFVFFLAVLLQAICALLTLQYYMEHWDKDYTKNPYIYLFSFVCAHVCIHVLLLVLFADDGKQ